MSKKFAALGLAVDSPSRMPIIYPGHAEPLKDKENNEAYLDLLSLDSEAVRKVDKRLRKMLTERAYSGRVSEDDYDIDEQLERLVAATVGWHLVAPDGSPIDLAFSVDAARELYAAPEMAWLRKRAWVRVANEVNFTKRASSDS